MSKAIARGFKSLDKDGTECDLSKCIDADFEGSVIEPISGGDPAICMDSTLFRAAVEDLFWALLNTPEFLFID